MFGRGRDRISSHATTYYHALLSSGQAKMMAKILDPGLSCDYSVYGLQE